MRGDDSGTAHRRAFAVGLSVLTAGLLTATGGQATPFRYANHPNVLRIRPSALIMGGRGSVGASSFGYSVAMSGDGRTILVGGPGDDGRRGAVWVFVRTHTGWVEQGPKLVGGRFTKRGDLFGASVALSRSGNVALVGAPGYNGFAGTVWVFRRVHGVWGSGVELVPLGETGAAAFGWAVSLSGDGQTALVGGPDDDMPKGYQGYMGKGAAWVFSARQSMWIQEGSKLTGSSETPLGDFGASVAIDGNGRAALVGAFWASGGFGFAWLFAPSHGTWQQLGRARPNDGNGLAQFGGGLALSGDGSRALITGPGDHGNRGALWTFSRDAPTWKQDGAKLVAPAGAAHPHFGISVAVSADGQRALVTTLPSRTHHGAAFLYTRTKSRKWELEGQAVPTGRLADDTLFGANSAMSASGQSFVLGGPAVGGKRGAVWVYT
jgi:hypothetical protein